MTADLIRQRDAVLRDLYALMLAGEHTVSTPRFRDLFARFKALDAAVEAEADYLEDAQTVYFDDEEEA